MLKTGEGSQATTNNVSIGVIISLLEKEDNEYIARSVIFLINLVRHGLANRNI
jgi:hypothetical protein